MFIEMMNLFAQNYFDIAILAIIMVSALIVFIGALKPILFDKITNKLLRKVALSASNIALCFGSVAVAFLINKIDFSYYLFSAIVFSVWSIVVYWLYENTGLRNLIHKIGSLTIGKVFGVISLKLNKENTDVVAELKKVGNELTTTTKNELRSTVKTADKELEKL